MKVFVLVREENQYDQFGSYFDGVFSTFPTEEQLGLCWVDRLGISRLLNKENGRSSLNEDTWWYILEEEI